MRSLRSTACGMFRSEEGGKTSHMVLQRTQSAHGGQHTTVTPDQVSSKSQGVQTLFQEQWRLEAACGGVPPRVEVHWDGMVVGSLSYFPKWRFSGIRYLVMPP